MAQPTEHHHHRVATAAANDPALAELLARTPAVIAPGHTFESVTDSIGHLVLSKRTPIGWFFGFAIAFALLIFNRIGKNLEDPFENRVYDTPMTALSLTIETNLRQALGETQLPEPVTPIAGVLW